MPKTTIIIAEKSCLIRKGLQSILQKVEKTDVVQTIGNKEEVCEIVNHIKPDILIASPDMLCDDANDLKKSFINGNQMTLVLVNADPNIKNQYKADAYIHYNDTQTEIIDLFQEIISRKSQNSAQDKSNETLSSREKNILKHIALGLTNKEIADQLFISIHTVVTHRKNITQKLGIKSVSGLTVYAILNNLISMDEVK